MCDTMIATAAVTRDGVALFGKNSDREPNEAHQLVVVPAADHEAGSEVRLTYVSIPQVAHTYAVFLAKPFWIWGAEMGANEHGLVIGNEAVFTRVPYEKGPAPMGMDLLRLGLERARTAREAVTVITDLLAEHGQGGNHGFHHQFYYHNSYILADPEDAWVLETAGRHWAARQILGIYTISNGLTIGGDWDLASADLVAHAVDQGWCRGREDFDFARCYSDSLYTRFSACHHRRGRSTRLLREARHEIDLAHVMATLRDHGGVAPADFRPDRGVTGAEVCMHAGFGPVRGSQSVGSMVSRLDPGRPLHFVTGTSGPCTSVFKPVWLDAGLPDLGPAPTGQFDPDTLFWRHEALHRAALRDYPGWAELIPDRERLEAGLRAEALACTNETPAARADLSAASFARAGAAEADWLTRLGRRDSRRRLTWHYSLAWRGFDRQAQMPSV